jgi:hypothetical protein
MVKMAKFHYTSRQLEAGAYVPEVGTDYGT